MNTENRPPCSRRSEVGVPVLVAKMQAAGLDRIIAEAQRQLDAYLGK